jgi:1-acyl-sn-glycerol-3-phosphate acyltransferase
MRRALEGIYTYLEFGTCALVWLPILATTNLMHRHDDVPRHAGRWMRRFGRVTSALTPLWTFSVDGTPPADIGTRAYVVVANHMSTADPFLLSWLPWDMQWIAKQELFRLPVLGLLLRFSGDISLTRGDAESVREMFSQCKHALVHGLSVMIFPEGTRSRDGRVKPFKDGAFQLAIEQQAPVLPIAIAGTGRCMPKGSPWFGRARAVARVLAPIETRGLTLADLPRLRDEARAAIERGVRDLEVVLEQNGDPETRPAVEAEARETISAP